jgi:hypothetical protein
MSVLGEPGLHVNAIGDRPRPTRFSLRPPIAHIPQTTCTPNETCSLIWIALTLAVPAGLNLAKVVLTHTLKPDVFSVQAPKEKQHA